ncbi:hypothetical protein [Curtobacterium sp. SL109]|uniref:hypothetical protein n=1 Tax=Curtobacterium sp. SL109 TaxID=2994662 RepID=UPI002273CEF3|nr:hypothetical protein [Curtobacterium sp. SL109]MCY1695079.1 hypothetical protein [Curtobacterium sp. SL109]
MKTIFGNIPFPFVAREDLVINGSLGNGLTVKEGCSLFVHGSVRGTLIVETGARLIVAGTLGAFVDRNDGTLAVAGEIATPVETIPGNVRIAAGTAVTVDAANQVVDGEGTLHAVHGVTRISLSSADTLTWDPVTSSFTQTRSHDFVELEGLLVLNPVTPCARRPADNRRKPTTTASRRTSMTAQTAQLGHDSISTALTTLAAVSTALLDHIGTTRQMEHDQHVRVQEALEAGCSWADIARALGVTPLVARERFDPHTRVQG